MQVSAGFMRSRAAEGIKCIEGWGGRERCEQPMSLDVRSTRFEANCWTQLSAGGSAPSGRDLHAAAFSDSAGGLLVFGRICRGLGTSSGAAGEGSLGRGGRAALRAYLNDCNDLHLYEPEAGEAAGSLLSAAVAMLFWAFSSVERPERLTFPLAASGEPEAKQSQSRSRAAQGPKLHRKPESRKKHQETIIALAILGDSCEHLRDS